VREVARGHVLRNRAGEGAGAPRDGPHVDGCIATRAGKCGSNEVQVREVSLGRVLRNRAGEGAGAPRDGPHVDGCIVVHARILTHARRIRAQARRVIHHEHRRVFTDRIPGRPHHGHLRAAPCLRNRVGPSARRRTTTPRS